MHYRIIIVTLLHYYNNCNIHYKIQYNKFLSYFDAFFVWFPDAPTVRMKSDPVYVNLGDTADLLCIADANPITYSMFSWKWMVSDVFVISVLLSLLLILIHFALYCPLLAQLMHYLSFYHLYLSLASLLFVSNSLFLSDFSFLSMCHSYSVTKMLYFTLLTTTMSHLYA